MTTHLELRLMPMLNRWDKPTENMEKKLLSSLKREYNDAYKAIRKEIAFYATKYGDGSLSPTEMLKYKRLDSMLDQVEKELVTLNKLTDKEIKNYLTEVYEFNYYHSAFTLEVEAQQKLAFSLINKKAVVEATQRPLSLIALTDNADQVIKDMRRALTQAVVQGLSVPNASKLVAKALDTNSNSATRIVRTETTGIMNKAREDAMVHAEKMGLTFKKTWIATLDNRTRDRHQELDGEEVAVDKPFSNGLMYPGDQTGDAAETINCRCSMGTIIEGLERSDRRAGAEVIPYTTYKEWEKNRLVNSN